MYQLLRLMNQSQDWQPALLLSLLTGNASVNQTFSTESSSSSTKPTPVILSSVNRGVGWINVLLTTLIWWLLFLPLFMAALVLGSRKKPVKLSGMLGKMTLSMKEDTTTQDVD